MDCKGFLTSAGSTMFGLVATPVLQHLCYPFRAARNVRRLRDSLKRLNDCQKDINERIQLVEESGGLKKPTSQTKGWLERAQEAVNEAEAVARDYDSRSCLLAGSCSFDCWSNYRISRRADEAIQQMAELLSQQPALEAVTTDAPLPPVQERPADFTVPGLEKNLEEAMRFLREKEEGMLGIWGMGGVGKTTLLTKINNSLLGDSRFDCVVWVVASKDCNVAKLQEKILKKLGLPEGRDAATSIFNFFRNKKFVLLIDDVWNALDLKEVGIPHPLGSMNQLKRKIILTTRSEDVCGMMGAHSRIRVDRLPQEHAWSLFKEMVGEETLGSHPGILILAERVAEECGGLPLALIVVGRSMSTKTSLRDWDNAIKLMQSSKHIPGTEKYLFHRLKLSYDNLEYSTDRECFLICSLWPEDYQIAETDLVDCWIGMDIIEDYATGNSILARLKATCLLEANERSYYYSNQSRFGYRDAVKMHDVIRDMALWIVSERGYKWMVLHVGLADGRRRWSESHIISLSHGRFNDDVPFEIPICPNLTTLMLSKNHTLGSSHLHILREVLSVNNLYSLTYLDLSRTGLHEVPNGVCGLVELGYLNLSDNRIQSLPEELKGLNKLKHLILRHNAIHTIPHGLLSKLKILQVLDLYTFHSDASPILDQLDLAESHLRAFGINVYTISELNKLSKLSGLATQSLGVRKLEGFMNSIRLSSSDTIGKHMKWTLNDLHIKDAGIQEILIESSSDHPQVVSLEALVYWELRDLVNLKAVIWKRVAPKDFFPRLVMVDIVYCGQLKHVSWILHLPCLECLYLGKCKNLKQVIELEEIQDDVQQGVAFPSLKFLHLSSLDRLDRICDPAVEFPSLERVGIYECSQLKHLPFQLIPACNHKKLLEIEGDREWWDGLEWEDDSIGSSLLPKFKQFDWATAFSVF